MRNGIAGLMVIFFFVLAGCSDKDSVPGSVLSIDKMTGIMWDMIQADQYAAFLAKDSAHINVRSEHFHLYDQVFQLHDVTREKFQKSYKYYLEHPELNQVLYDSLNAQGNRLRSEAYSHPSTRPVPTVPPVTPAATPSKPPPFLPGRPFKPVIPGKGSPLKQDTAKKRHPRPKGPSSNPATLRTLQ